MDRFADETRNHAKVVLAATEVSMACEMVRAEGIHFFSRELPMPEMGEQKN